MVKTDERPEKKVWPTSVIVYTDGASRGNPGPASIGVYFTDQDGEVLAEYGEKLGTRTNNFAEYTAVVRALEIALENSVSQLLLRSDSELMVKQMTGLYKVKSEAIRPLFEKARSLTTRFKNIRFEHVRREFNQEADHLANLALDE